MRIYYLTPNSFLKFYSHHCNIKKNELVQNFFSFNEVRLLYFALAYIKNVLALYVVHVIVPIPCSVYLKPMQCMNTDRIMLMHCMHMDLTECIILLYCYFPINSKTLTRSFQFTMHTVYKFLIFNIYYNI